MTATLKHLEVRSAGVMIKRFESTYEAIAFAEQIEIEHNATISIVDTSATIERRVNGRVIVAGKNHSM